MLVTALLSAQDHPTHIDVVIDKNLFAVVNGGSRQRSAAAQNPGKVHVKQSQDVSAGINQC